MTPLERLLAEELPTGTFGDARPAHDRSERAAQHKTPQTEAARHLAELAAAVGARRLRPVPDTDHPDRSAA